MNLRKAAPVLAAIFIISLLLAGCSGNSGKEAADNAAETAAETLEQYRTDYVGDNSSVSHIARLTEYPEGFSYDHIAIHSEEEPYGLTVYLACEPDASATDGAFDACADTAFDLIGNLSHIDYVNVDTGDALASYDRG